MTTIYSLPYIFRKINCTKPKNLFEKLDFQQEKKIEKQKPKPKPRKLTKRRRGKKKIKIILKI